MLAAGLGAAAIVQRGELPAMSSDNCEIVTCQMPDESVKRLFCKFGPLSEPVGPTHCFGLGYEARVYDEVLRVWADNVPPLHGVFLDEAAQVLVLALDYLEGGTPLHQVWQPKFDLGAAVAVDRPFPSARRDGHRAGVSPPLRHRVLLHLAPPRGRLYAGLASALSVAAGIVRARLRRLPALLGPATIIHGEYQANNILVYGGRCVPTDWESAALAAGEIDLASLAWGWEDDIATHCEEQYCLVRWPDSTPDDFALRLTAARVFLHLRWLGDSEPGEDSESTITAVEELAPLAERFAELDR